MSNPAADPADPTPGGDLAPDPKPNPAPAADPAPDPAPADDPAPSPDGGDPKPGPQDWPDDWRERLAGDDADLLRELRRYGSLANVARALKESKDTIRSGKVRRDMPDPKDAKAVAEWRKEQGIPEDATGYKLPDAIAKLATDADKPNLASFFEFAHGKNLPQSAVDAATEWYFAAQEKALEQRAAADAEAIEAAEDTLRKEWAPGEYKANLTLGKRFLDSIPEVGASWAEARLPDGRRLGDVPAFVVWASEQGRQQFGDVTFASADSETRHNNRKAEIEEVMKTDINAYYDKGLDKEYAQILEREQRRKRD